MAAHFAKAAENHCEFEDRSDETALIALQGPKALDVLDAAGERRREARASSRASTSATPIVANVRCTVARTGYTGEDGVEIFCASERRAAALARAHRARRSRSASKPAGLGARDTLRLEARLSLYGNDIDETTNPLEAGLGWVVKLDKRDVRRQGGARGGQGRAGLPRKLVGFEMTGRGIARHGYPLRDLDGNEVGICTSGSPGPTVGKNIGLGYLPAAMTAVGTKFLVDCRGKNVEAVVVKTPFYKRAELSAEHARSRQTMNVSRAGAASTRRITSGRRSTATRSPSASPRSPSISSVTSRSSTST